MNNNHHCYSLSRQQQWIHEQINYETVVVLIITTKDRHPNPFQREANNTFSLRQWLIIWILII